MTSSPVQSAGTTPPSGPIGRRISLVARDPEQWLGIKSGRFTRPTQFVSALVGLILTTVYYVIINQFPDSTAHIWFTELGWVPYAIVFFTSWSLTYLLLKWIKILAQQQALHLRIVPEDPLFILTPDSADQVLLSMYDRADEPRGFLLLNRVWTALSSMKNFRRLGDLEDLLQAQADNDEGTCESSYTVIRGLVWAIPVLGFIGTVIGLSEAIGSFGEVLASSSNIEEIRTELQSVTSGLRIAFITTLEALVAALGLQLLLTAIRRWEEQFLDDCREYCQSNLVARVRIEPTARRSTTTRER